MKNTRIAKELVKLAKMLVGSFGDEFRKNAMDYFKSCFRGETVTGESGKTYAVSYDGRHVVLTALKGVVPELETVDELDVSCIYNDAVDKIKKNYYDIDGYEELRTSSIESNENHYMLNNREFAVNDSNGDIVDTTDEFNDSVENDAMELAFDELRNGVFMDIGDMSIVFRNADGCDSGVVQELADINSWDD